MMTEQRIVPLAHSIEVVGLAFSPVLATATSSVASVWDVATWQQTASFPHQDMVYGIALSPDGQFLATIGSKAIQFWPYWPEDLVSVAQRCLNREPTSKE